MGVLSSVSSDATSFGLGNHTFQRRKDYPHGEKKDGWAIMNENYSILVRKRREPGQWEAFLHERTPSDTWKNTKHALGLSEKRGCSGVEGEILDWLQLSVSIPERGTKSHP